MFYLWRCVIVGIMVVLCFSGCCSTDINEQSDSSLEVYVALPLKKAQKLKVGVVGFFQKDFRRARGNWYELMRSRVEGRFLEMGFRVITKSSQEITMILSTLEKEYQDIFDENSVKKLGRLLGVDLIFYGMIHHQSRSNGGFSTLSMKLMNVQSGEIFATMTTYAQGKTISESGGKIWLKLDPLWKVFQKKLKE